MKKGNLVIIVVFILFLIGPNAIYYLVRDKMDNKNYENRKLYSKPDFNLKTITSYPNNYENYFNDYLAFKNEIRKLRSFVNYNLFQTSSNNKVIVGKDGWLFYNSDEAGDGITISELRHINNYEENEISEINNNIIATKKKLKDQGIDLYVWVISNKENIYSEYLPKVININNNGFKSKIEKLIENGNKAQIIYVKDELLKGKKSHNVFYKYDTHWNDFGAYLGVNKLMTTINPSYNISDVKIGYNQYGGDLGRMNLMYNLTSKEPTNISFIKDVNVKCNKSKKIKTCNSNGKEDKTILVIGDSFAMREESGHYLSKIYKKSVFIHRDTFKKSFIEEYNPDIIVYESVERYVKCLKDINLLVE